MFDKNTGEVLKIYCPSIYCSDRVLVPLVDGKIGPHDGVIPGLCPWIGTRVIDDRADFTPRDVTTVEAQP
ncbi:hypothetical protein [Nocardia sp. XZ_19_369]|uniref:hypothetical protein n=1 Tax=Nocardia sp. XZ_19_369 TaxID=2769487 RepID=UPI00188EA45E|nr:hypothetical protein [Nocardia sp. XZ_19_369]